MLHYYKYRAVSNRMEVAVDFGLLDSRGRKIGAIISRYEVDVIEMPPGSTGGMRFRSPRIGVGVWPVGAVQMTRDGKSYGASFHSEVFSTSEEREAHIERRLADMKKRMIKKFGV